jgi:hypothetical protein
MRVPPFFAGKPDLFHQAWPDDTPTTPAWGISLIRRPILLFYYPGIEYPYRV